MLPSRSAAVQAGSVATPAMLTWTLKTGTQAQPVTWPQVKRGLAASSRNRELRGRFTPSRLSVDTKWTRTIRMRHQRPRTGWGPTKAIESSWFLPIIVARRSICPIRNFMR